MSRPNRPPHDDPEQTSTHLPGERSASVPTGSGRTAVPAGPGPTIGPYRLIRQIGEGGMGQVWLAEQTEPVTRRVALKLVRAGRFDAALLGRFEAERQALAIMEHPAIAKVFDAGSTPDGQPYFVMEYVDGQPITEYCDTRQLPLPARLALFMQVCEGVQHAHLKAIIHRDLKPSNVLVTEIDGRPAPRIIDFGIAKAIDPLGSEATQATSAGSVIGTLGYMSPEQADPRVADVDTRADVYALGVILFELLTGSRPFEAHRAPLDEVLRRLREDDPPALVTAMSRDTGTAGTTAERRGVDLGQLTGMLRGDLDSITRKALARERDRRYATPLELAADLQRYLSDLPVEARPASTLYLVRKHVRRHRFGIAAGAVVLLLLVGFAIAQAVQLRRITRERDRADRIAAFMTSIFSVVSPSEARGRNVSAREVLDRAAREITTTPDLDPVVRARLMATMGRTYLGLGQYERAEELLAPAAELQARALGPDAKETLETTARRGLVLASIGRLDQAQELLTATLARQQALFGPQDPSALATMDDLAQVLSMQGKPADAEKMLREVIRMSAAARGAEHPETLHAKRSLCVALYDQARYADAEGCERESLAVERRVLGPDHPGTLLTMSNLARALGRLGRPAEAEQINREVHAASARVNGPDHRNTWVAFASIIDDVRQQGRFDEAVTMSRELLAARQRLNPPGSPDVIDALDMLAVALGTAGQTAEAASIQEQALELRRKQLGPDAPTVGASTLNLAFTLSYAGRHAEADPYYREAIRIAGTTQRQNAVSDAWLGYAMGATMAGKKDLAFDCLRRSLDTGFGYIAQLGALDDLKPLRGDPRFQVLLAEITSRSAGKP
jgi:non-specific serine/threonine protein kinase/serine/threonine-protein kinase